MDDIAGASVADADFSRLVSERWFMVGREFFVTAAAEQVEPIVCSHTPQVRVLVVARVLPKTVRVQTRYTRSAVEPVSNHGV